MSCAIVGVPTMSAPGIDTAAFDGGVLAQAQRIDDGDYKFLVNVVDLSTNESNN